MKPFYSATIHIESNEQYEMAKEKMKYFTIDGCQSRALPHDPSLRGEMKVKVMSQNVFYKLPKDADKNSLTYRSLHEKFEKYGPIKSTKISINPDYTPRGFAFVCFENEESTKACIADKANEGTVF